MERRNDQRKKDLPERHRRTDKTAEEGKKD
jgi:hypothetical protein